MKALKLRLAGGALLGALLLPGFVRAGTTGGSALFDFEDQQTSSGSLSTLTLSNNGTSATITQSGQTFDIVDLSAQSGASAFGARSLTSTAASGTPFMVDLSQPVSSFSAQIGDFGSATIDTLTMTAFSGHGGTGTMLGTQTTMLPLLDATTLAFKSIEVDAAGIESVQIMGGPSGSNSAFYDNFGVTVASSGTGGGTSSVPLPAAAWAAPFGALVAFFGARNLRRASRN
jgi:hypothetical protein